MSWAGGIEDEKRKGTVEVLEEVGGWGSGTTGGKFGEGRSV